jgi:four helix bundle protein
MYQHSFEKLNVCQDSLGLIERIYQETKTFPEDEKFGLVSQIRRASISICSNIAEGTSRISTKDKSHFLTMAFSSTMELLSQLIISNRLHFLNDNVYMELRELTMKVSNKLKV